MCRNHQKWSTAKFFEDAEVRDGLPEEWLGLRHLTHIFGGDIEQVHESVRFAGQRQNQT